MTALFHKITEFAEYSQISTELVQLIIDKSPIALQRNNNKYK